MKTIWKFPIEVSDEVRLNLPQGALPFRVDVQRDQPCMWVLLDTEAEVEERVSRVFGTGHPCDRFGDEYIDTFQMAGGSVVLHVFEENARLPNPNAAHTATA